VPSKSTFDFLVKELSYQERRELLDKLATKESLTLSRPSEKEEEVLPDYKQILKRFSWLTQLILYLKSLFNGLSLETTVKEQLFIDLGYQLQHRFPSWLQARTRMFFPQFYYELKNFFDALDVFIEPLNIAMNRDKGEFFAYLIGNAMEEIQQRILYETDFWMVYEENQEKSINDIKTIVEGNLRVILDSIPQDIKKRVYNEIKKLHYLNLLVNLPKEQFLSPFFIADQGPNPAPFKEFSDLLVTFWSRLSALDDEDLTTVLESLFIFYIKAKMFKKEDWFAELDFLMSKTKQSLETIRDFRTRVPLGKFCALVTKNLEIKKEPLPGIEDWFSIYKSFWKSKIAQDFKIFNRERSQKMIQISMTHFLGISEEEFENLRVYPKVYTDEIYPYQDKTLTFLRLFFTRVFPQHFHPLLKLIFVEGEFYKKANKSEFCETYTQLLRFSEEVEKLSNKISLQGEWGSKIKELEKLSKDQQILEIKSIFQTAAESVKDVVRRITPVLQSLYNLLHGIVKTEAGGVYDGLSNLSHLGGKNNPNVRRDLITLSNRADLLLKIILQLAEIEQD